MQRRFKINVEGRDYDVLVEEILDDSGGLYPDRRTMRAEPAASGAAGVAVTPEAVTGKSQSGSTPEAGPGDVVSPLSGVVLSIDVELGAGVEAETRIATLEAMKTKTMVAAGRAGKVSAIAVSAGQGVEAGQALITIA